MLSKTELWAGSHESEGAGKKFCVPSSPRLARWWQGPALPHQPHYCLCARPGALEPRVPQSSLLVIMQSRRVELEEPEERKADTPAFCPIPFPACSPPALYLQCPRCPGCAPLPTAAFSLRVPSLFFSPTSHAISNHTPPGSPSPSRLPTHKL